MTRSLPTNASLENLKKQAKTLQKKWRAGDSASLARIRVSHPHYADASDDELRNNRARLTDCQLVLAREFGFDSWPAMKRAIELADTELADQLLELGVIYYYGPNSLDIPRANELLIEHPQLAEANIWSAATVGNTAAVVRFLDGDPSLVNQNGGSNEWPPLLYLCYSRVRGNRESHDPLSTAKLLLDRGADPDAHYWIEDSYKFTCVTGAIGEGEAGVKMWPPHQHATALATLLLKRGANPNDSQGLYNSMFSGGTHWLRLLLDHGLTNEPLINWATDNKMPTMDYLLAQACKYGQFDRAELLLDRGASPNARDWYDNRACYEHAIARGNPEIAELLVRHGAEPVEPDSARQRFFNACMRADRAAVESIRGNHSDEEIASWIDSAEAKKKLPEAAESNKLDAVRLMLELGFPISTALFEAAWNGHMDIARLLVQHGASARQRNEHHFVTPVAYADRAGHLDLRDFLLEKDIDIFDAIDFDRPDRLEEILVQDAGAIERTFGAHTGDEEQDGAWQTPLTWAVEGGKADAVGALLNHGADINVQSPAGQTLLQLATECGFEEIVAMLKKAEAG